MGFFAANSSIESFCVLKGESVVNFISENTREMTGVQLSKFACRMSLLVLKLGETWVILKTEKTIRMKL
jgi:hypothetical protein